MKKPAPPPPPPPSKAVLVRFDPELAAAVHADAKVKGQTVTVWMARAAQAALTPIPEPIQAVVVRKSKPVVKKRKKITPPPPIVARVKRKYTRRVNV